jgi:hypothetical protein
MKNNTKKRKQWEKTTYPVLSTLFALSFQPNFPRPLAALGRYQGESLCTEWAQFCARQYSSTSLDIIQP